MLSKQTTDQIRKEAESVKSIDNDDHVPSLINGYIVGAMRWAVWKEKADGLERALKELVKAVDHLDDTHVHSDAFTVKIESLSHKSQLANKVLEQFK